MRTGRVACTKVDLDRIEFDANSRRLIRLSFRVASPIEPDEVVLFTGKVIEAPVSFCCFGGVPFERWPRCNGVTVV